MASAWKFVFFVHDLHLSVLHPRLDFSVRFRASHGLRLSCQLMFIHSSVHIPSTFAPFALRSVRTHASVAPMTLTLVGLLGIGLKGEVLSYTSPHAPLGVPPTPLSDSRTFGVPRAPPSRPMHGAQY